MMKNMSVDIDRMTPGDLVSLNHLREYIRVDIGVHDELLFVSDVAKGNTALIISIPNVSHYFGDEIIIMHMGIMMHASLYDVKKL